MADEEPSPLPPPADPSGAPAPGPVTAEGIPMALGGWGTWNRPALPADLLQQAREFAAAARAPRTRHEYARAWRMFVAWAESQGLEPLPAAPETVALYLTARAGHGRRPATLEQDLAAIAGAHRATGHPSPRDAEAVRAVRAGIRRERGTAPKKAAPLLVGHLRTIAAALPKTLLGARDRALLLVGFAGAFRRSELAGIRVEDLEWTEEGLKVRLARSKTDQEGEGRTVAIPRSARAALCPVRGLEAWLAAAGIEAGAVFREVTRHGAVGESALSDRSVARVVKRAVAAAGLDPAPFAGHSLRAGLATAAAKAGKTERSIMRQTGHKSPAMVQGYIREAELFDDNAAEGLL